ncbi:MAG TPA: T9SS type A sorting domain-containing protein [Bacteroidales bacterium]|nr:T9SS type A sorting domain-containing protein [Bacteroidales bacterium]
MELKIYPNPADDYIIIETGISEPSTFKLFDMIGKMVLISEVSDKEKLSIKDLGESIYYYKLVADTRLQAGKLRLNR